jgi:hypothetical protein
VRVRFRFTGGGMATLHVNSIAELTESDASNESIIDEVAAMIRDQHTARIEIADVDKAAICDAVREEIAKQKARAR